ncbi:MAG TPA: ABC transporter substrate-binding protein [Chloroflexota bacterium]|nr:ABC transporter substrate-binding protein [Chloroflexota bacterium]
MADAAGIFKKNGLDVKITYIASSQGIPALISGETQIANVGGSETLSAVAGGADLVTVTNDSPVYPFIVQVAPQIKSIADLKGKKLGVSNFGSASDIALRVGLQRKGLNPDKDVSIISVGSASNRLAAMQSGAIVGGVSFPPASLKLEAQGFHTLIDLSALNAPAAIGTGVLSRSYFKAHHDVAQKYVDSVVEAIARAKKDEPFTVNVLEKYFKSNDTKAMQATYDYFVNHVIPALPYPKPEQYADSKAVLGKKNAKVAAFDVAKMLDDSLVQSAADRGLNK